MPRLIGTNELKVGNFDTARSYLREAMRVEKDESMRRYLACQLAWIEEDPHVAAALLEQSCGGAVGITVDPVYNECLAPTNALDLCVTTGSKELADYYYHRYRDSWRRWLDIGTKRLQEMNLPKETILPKAYLPAPCHPETLTWLQERLARDESR